MSEWDTTTMLVFGVFEGERESIDVPIGALVGEVKQMFQKTFGIYVDELSKKDRNIVVVHYCGSDLDESWCFTDLGIAPGSTVKLCMKEEIKPVLFIYCTYNEETVDIVDNDLVVPLMSVADLRSSVAAKTGLPVSIFRILSPDGKEMFDEHTLYDYNIDAGMTIRQENWDGWNEFINLCTMGFTPQVLAQISSDEVISRFQLKVALAIAAHFGCVDLARNLIKQGVRADEPTGEHPSRQWCGSASHIQTFKCPIHEAVENGQLAIVRLFVNQDITVVMAKDGNSLNALNIALRKKQKACATFLLTRQWTKVPVGKFGSISVQTLRKIKTWSLRAKEKAYAKFGPSRSTMKKRSFTCGALVSYGPPVVNGVLPNPISGRPKLEMRDRDRQKAIDSFHEVYGIRGDPENYFKQMGSLTSFKNLKMKRDTKWASMIGRSDVAVQLAQGITQDADIESSASKSKNRGMTQSSALADSSISEDSKFQAMKNRRKSIRLEEALNEKDETLKKEPAKTTFMAKQKRRPSDLQLESQDTERGSKKLPPIKSDAVKEEDEPHSPNNRARFFQTPSKDLKGTKALPDIRGDAKTTEPPLSPKSVGGKSQALSEKSSEKKGKKRKRMSSAILLSKAKAASEGAIPLPLVSTENISRPFFYHNGQREEDVVQPIIDLVSKYQGVSSRDRAIKSLTIANTFKEKAWLNQIRMAMTLTENSIKRTFREKGG